MGASGVVVVEPATHGSISVDHVAEELVFTPDFDFWGLSHDRFVISWTAIGTPKVTVLLVSSDQSLDLVTSFEIGEPLPDGTGDSLDISSAGVLVGDRGIYREVSPQSNVGFGSFGWQTLGTVEPGEPTGNGASGEIVILIDTPPPGGGGFFSDPGFWSLFGAYDTAGNMIAEIQVGYDDLNENTLLRGNFDDSGNGNSLSTGDVILSAGVHRLRLEAWTNEDGGLRIFVDDLPVLGLGSPPNLLGSAFDGLALGQLSGAPLVEQTTRIDHLRVARGIEQPYWDLVVADDFDGDLTAWANIVDNAGQVSTEAASETLHLDLVGALGSESYLRDPTPSAAAELSVRFSVDTTSLTMAAGDLMFIQAGYSGSPGPANHVQMRMKSAGNDFEIRAEAKDDSGALSTTAWQPLSRGEHTLELRWRAATASDVEDGYVRLFLDGAFADQALGLQNAGRRVETLRLGAIGVDSGTHGLLVFDDYVSWESP